MDSAQPSAPPRISAWPVFTKLTESSANSNLLFSPLAAEVMLASLLAGLTGVAERALRDLLNLDEEDGEILLLHLAADLQRMREDISLAEFHLASGFWVHFDRLKLRGDLAELFRNALQMTVKEVDFREKTTLPAIDEWASRHTNGKIRTLSLPGRPPWLPPDQPYPLFLAANALFLKAGWLHDFDPYPFPGGLFVAADGQEYQMEFMEKRVNHAGSGIGYLQNEEFRAVRIPFRGKELVMDVILPWKKTGLVRATDHFLNAGADHWDKRFHEVDRLYLLLPEFSLKQQINFATGPLGKMLSPLFRPGSDLDAMFVKSDPEEPMAITDIVQSVSIRVDQTGAEAAAITLSYAIATGFPEPAQGELIVFEASHPFLFRIRHPATGRDLMAGTLGQGDQQAVGWTEAERRARQAYRASIPLAERLAQLTKEQLRFWAQGKYEEVLRHTGLDSTAWANPGPVARWEPILADLLRYMVPGGSPLRHEAVEVADMLQGLGWTHQQAVDLVRQAVRYPVLVHLGAMVAGLQTAPSNDWLTGLISGAMEAGIEL